WGVGKVIDHILKDVFKGHYSLHHQQVQRSAISEAKREDISKHGIEDHEVDLQQALRMNIFILDVASLKKEAEPDVKKKYCLGSNSEVEEHDQHYGTSRRHMPRAQPVPDHNRLDIQHQHPTVR
ncbi:hypothetical protein Tco_1003536, partial [Tanacetum coccineum]